MKESRGRDVKVATKELVYDDNFNIIGERVKIVPLAEVLSGRKDLAAIDRILDKVGSKFVPADFHRGRLKNDLDKFRVTYLGFTKKTQQKKRAQLIKKIQKCASELFDVLERPLDLELSASIWAGLNSVSSRELQLALKELHGAVSNSSAFGATAKKSWCICLLADIFERHFRRVAKVSRPPHGGKLTGPFVRFVESIAAASGIAMSAESIPPALAARRRGNCKKSDP
jgi:hypothetical protein